jgi:hypothetical protein
MKIKLFAFLVLFLFSNLVFAEGQDGLNSIIGFGYLFMIITNLFFYTFILGMIFKFIFFKQNSKNGYQKSFLFSFLISVMLLIIFKDGFTFLIFNWL